MKTLITYLVILFIFHSQLFAQSWEEQAVGILPNNYGVFGISVVDENVVWAVAFDQSIGNTVPLNHKSIVLKTVDGGLSWESFEVEEAEGRISFDIRAIDSNVAYITTQDYNNGNGRGVFKTEDGGATWVEKFHNIAAGVWIRFFNELDGIVINRQSMAITNDGGESWEAVPSGNIPPFQSDEFTLIISGNNSCESIGNHIWFGTNKGRVYRSKDKGNTWQAFSTGLGANATILSVAFKDTLTGIALNTSNNVTLYAKTNDGGETWTTAFSNPGVYITNTEYVPGTDSTLIGTSAFTSSTNGLVSVYSNDLANNWETVNSGIPLTGIEFFSPTVGWTARRRVTSSSQAVMYKWQGDVFTTSVKIAEKMPIAIFPNPVTDVINIVSPKIINTYRLSSIHGKLIQTQKLNAKQHRVYLQHLIRGIYLLELLFEDGSIATEKIVKGD